MLVKVELADKLARRARTEAAASFDGDVERLLRVALDSYLTTQDMIRRLLPAPAPPAKRFKLDPKAFLDFLGAKGVDPADLIKGTTTLPDPAAARWKKLALGVTLAELLAGEKPLAPDVVAKLPPDVLVPFDPDPGEVDLEEQVAKVIAESRLGSDRLGEAAAQMGRLAELVPKLRGES
jgi:hypothetical protein